MKTIPNVTWLKPDMTFRKVLEKYGYPVIGKEQAKWIDEARRGNAEGQSRRLYGIRKGDKKSTFRISEQWHYLMNAPFKISDECCNEMKKKPMKRYAHETGRVPIIGTMAEESKLRTQHWLQEGCNAYDAKRPTSKPMSFWTEADVWQYIRENNIPYSKIYDMGYGRTGCIFCMFGAHFDGEPTRFQRLQRTHPKLWRYCMKDWEAGGLGMRQVLEYMGIPFENYIGEINGNTENSGCPLESCGLQSPCRSQAGRQGIRETETVNQSPSLMWRRRSGTTIMKPGCSARCITATPGPGSRSRPSTTAEVHGYRYTLLSFPANYHVSMFPFIPEDYPHLPF